MARKSLQKPAAKTAKTITAIDQEWFRRRQSDLDVSTDQIAAALGLHRVNAYAMLRGERKAQIADIPGLARILETSVAEIIRRCGVDYDPVTSPVVGRIDGAGDVRLFGGDVPRRVIAPTEEDEGLVALRVDGADSAIEYLTGAFAFYAPKDLSRSPATDVLSVVACADLQTRVGILSANGSRYKFSAWGVEKKRDLVGEISAAKIKWLRLSQ